MVLCLHFLYKEREQGHTGRYFCNWLKIIKEGQWGVKHQSFLQYQYTNINQISWYQNHPECTLDMHQMYTVRNNPGLKCTMMMILLSSFFFIVCFFFLVFFCLFFFFFTNFGLSYQSYGNSSVFIGNSDFSISTQQLLAGR